MTPLWCLCLLPASISLEGSENEQLQRSSKHSIHASDQMFPTMCDRGAICCRVLLSCADNELCEPSVASEFRYTALCAHRGDDAW